MNPRGEEGKDDEMKEAVRRQIGLVIGVERINEPRGHQVGELGESPRHRHDQREHEVGAAEHEQPRARIGGLDSIEPPDRQRR